MECDLTTQQVTDAFLGNSFNTADKYFIFHFPLIQVLTFLELKNCILQRVTEKNGI